MIKRERILTDTIWKCALNSGVITCLSYIKARSQRNTHSSDYPLAAQSVCIEDLSKWSPYHATLYFQCPEYIHDPSHSPQSTHLSSMLPGVTPQVPPPKAV